MTHILITGVPGIGKTTLITKLASELRSSATNVSNKFKIEGFYTQEIRDPLSRERTGFKLVDINQGGSFFNLSFLI